ncbi:type II toxin-antitoxin system HicA family toxin [Vagococcus xieshaowenii]|uniref:Type II toxin-antitoxin system HicA family toxin n=1 Tax=Vagococcus xieshaowenii TaxID=2562451 RepID=A0AAJ5JQX0_9ENTE|nr:type II toxin-antitoxin system HicA family toxin [Vagococcus xieshaowenii]QCA29700.1 type II toxin-antitoxin system HicA family toxin [Vagococcus xieshaowenii]TFZ42915.1 type II toxin-antitoxin system HicA family toxin [Vagococcus xieshaowenii]
MPLTDREMIKLLVKEGWIIKPKQGKGSHTKLTKEGHRRPIIVPKGELKYGTERSILKEAGLL